MTNTDDNPSNADSIETESMRARRAITEADELARERGEDTIGAALAREMERGL